MKKHLRPLLMLFTALLLMFATGLSAAQAASPHFKKNGEPVCTVTYTAASSSSTTCHTVLAGLGGEDLLAKVTVYGSAVYQCKNQGGNVAPGQNKVLVGPVTAPTLVPKEAIKNGNLTLDTEAAVLTAPTTATAADAGCANSNWTGVNPVLSVTKILLVIEQPEGTVIFTCSATGTRLSGQVPLTC